MLCCVESSRDVSSIHFEVHRNKIIFRVLSYKAPVDLLQGIKGHNTTRPQWREGFRSDRLVKVPSTRTSLLIYRSQRKWSVIKDSSVAAQIPLRVFT